jgi:hypothetical protein
LVRSGQVTATGGPRKRPIRRKIAANSARGMPPRRVERLRSGRGARSGLFLAETIYGGSCRHELIRIDYSNRFSDRV